MLLKKILEEWLKQCEELLWVCGENKREKGNCELVKEEQGSLRREGGDGKSDTLEFMETKKERKKEWENMVL